MANSIEWEGREWLLSEKETGRLVQPGPVVVISRREAEGRVTVCKRRRKEDRFKAKHKMYAAQAKAFQKLLDLNPEA